MANYRGLDIAISLMRIGGRILRHIQRATRSQEFYREAATVDKWDLLATGHFLGNSVTLAVTAKFFTIPPKTTGPSGVSRRPRPSARGSYVF
jgi:hypothetical protein